MHDFEVYQGHLCCYGRNSCLADGMHPARTPMRCTGNLRNIHCSQLISCSPVVNMPRSKFCILDLVRQSAMFSFELTNPMLEISRVRSVSRAACMSSIIRFSLVRVPLLIMSTNDFESVKRGIGIAHSSVCSICDRITKASSNKSAKAITSAERIDLVTFLDF